MEPSLLHLLLQLLSFILVYALVGTGPMSNSRNEWRPTRLFFLLGFVIDSSLSDHSPKNPFCAETDIADFFRDRMFPAQDVGKEFVRKPQRMFNSTCYFMTDNETFSITGNPNNSMTNQVPIRFLMSDSIQDNEKNCSKVPDRPSNVPNNIKILVIRNTNIISIDQRDLRSWFFVEEIHILLNDYLTEIKPNTFKNFNNLWKLKIMDNPRFSYFSEESLFGLPQLRGLFLVRNNIRSVANISKALSPEFVPRLVRLDLTGNTILKIDKNDFLPLKGGFLNTLIIQMTKTTEIHPNALDPLGDSLVALGFKKLNVNCSTLLKFLSRTVIANKNLKYVNFEQNLNCAFPEKLMKIMSNNTIALIIGKNHVGLLQPGSFAVMKNLVYLDLSEIMIDEIPEGVINITIFPKLEQLYLSNNKFTKLTHSMVIPTLVRLAVSQTDQKKYDLDSSLQVPYFSIENGVLGSMPNLQLLDLSGNNMNCLTEETFREARELTVLLLTRTSLNDISPRTFQNNKKLYYLDLSHNPFPLVIKQKNRSLGEIFYGLDNLLALDLSHCNINYLNKEIFTHVGKLQYISLQGNPIYKIWPSTFASVPYLKHINLRYTIIISWAENIFTDKHCLKKIILNFNNIVTLTKAMLEDFTRAQEVDLFGNSISCNCELLDNVYKMTSNWSNSAFMEATKCSYPTDSSLKEYLVNHVTDCVSYTNVIVACSLMSIIIVALVTAIIYFKYKYEIQYRFLLFKKKLGITNYYKRRQNTTNGPYRYDAFVSYSAQDSGFVEKMRLILEKDGSKFNLCVFERDFQPGDNLVDKILESMEMSKVTILVLTEAFAKSEWCRWEMSIAQNRTISQRFLKDSLILIIKNQIEESLMSPTLRFLMDTRVYLEWHEHSSVRQNIFWEKLKNALKERTQDKITQSEDQLQATQNSVRKRMWHPEPQQFTESLKC